MWNPFRKRKVSQPTPDKVESDADENTDLPRVSLKDDWPADTLTITMRRSRRYKRPKGSTLERNGPNIRYIEIKGYTRGVIELPLRYGQPSEGIVVPLDMHLCVRPGELTRTLVGRYYGYPVQAPRLACQ